MQKSLEKFNYSIYKYLIPILFLVVPLYPKFPLFNIPGTYVAIRAEDFLIFIMGLLLCVYILRTNIINFFRQPVMYAMFLFLAAGLVSVLSGWLLTKTIQPHIGFFHWLRRIEYLIPFVFVFAVSRLAGKKGFGAKDLRYFMETIFISTFFVFLYGLGQMYFNFPVISTQNEEYSKGTALRWVTGARLHSTFAGHYDLAAYLVMFFPVAIAYLITTNKRIHQAIVIFFALLPGYWLLLQTEARISYIAFLIGVSVTFWFLRKKMFIVPFLVISIFVTIMYTDLGARYRYTLEVYKQKIIQKLNRSQNFTPKVYAQDRTTQYVSPIGKDKPLPEPVTEDRSTSIRLKVEWPRAFRAFFKNPLLGTGYSSITLATDNDYLRLLGEVGVVGTLAFVLLLMRILVGCRGYLKSVSKFGIRSAFVAGFLGAFVGVLVNATFIDVFEASKVALVFWTIAGVAFSITNSTNKYARNSL